MKPSILDELEANDEKAATTIAKKVIIENNIAGFKMPESYSCLKDIKDVANLTSSQKGYALRVIENLYYYNSKVKILKDAYSDIQLLVLPEAEVIIDLFHNKKEEFIGDEKVKFNEDGELILAEEYSGYVYYALSEALLANQLLQSVCELEPWRNGVIQKGIIVENADRKLWQNILNIVFHGKHNWSCNICYSAMKKDLEYNLLPFQVLCYESSYIRNVDNYYVETNCSIESEKELQDLDTTAEFAIFVNNPNNQSAGDLRFEGFFAIDIEKSKEMRHVSFKSAKTVWDR